MQAPRVAIIILCWNSLADILECIDSLQQSSYPNYEVIIVDNGSTDESVSVIRERFPALTVLENGENLGFAGGNNVGLLHALARGADYVLLLNDDTEVASDLLCRLVEAMVDDPGVGVVGPTIYYHEQPNVIWSAGGTIDWRQGNAELVGLNEQDAGQFGVTPRPVDYVTGCAILLRRTVLEQVGLLDERFFAYYEETEWCVRIQQAGYRIMHVPQAKVWHKIPPDDGRAHSPLVHYYMTRNRLLFLRLAGAGPSAWLHTLVVGYLRTLISWSVRPKWRGKRPQRDMMLVAVRDYFANRFGRAPIG